MSVVSNAAVNTGVQLFLQNSDLISFGYMPRSGIAESCAGSIFNFLTNLLTVSIVAEPIYIPIKSAQ